MSKKALISDIHSNLEALCAVFNDIDSLAVEDILCLGDIVGYGGAPASCIDHIMKRARFSLMGNHDYALINNTKGFNPLAAEMIEHTRKQLKPKENNLEALPETLEPHYYTCSCKEERPHCMVMDHTPGSRWDFEKSLKQKVVEGTITYVHGSPLDPVMEYVYPNLFERLWNPDRLEQLFEEVSWLCFCGHTHIPCVIASDMSCVYPWERDYEPVSLDPNLKYIINLGSVGQPRDRDTRSSYVVLDEDNRTVSWRRVSYNIDAAMERIVGLCGRENWCSARLMLGR